MKQPKLRKRYIVFASLPLLYQSFVAPIAGSLSESWKRKSVVQESESVRQFILSHKARISPPELEVLIETILAESNQIQDGACGIYCEEGEKVGLLLGIIRVESEFFRKARSKKNARGYMQVVPNTGAWMGRKEGIKVQPESLFETKMNIHLGVSYLNHLIDSQEGNIRKALLAYNAGPAAVKKWGGVKQYAEDVFYFQEEYLGMRK
ncbi:transglycosylase [Leptospira perolatii]|uniref:Transglycosylase n=1 Tax=Leptospira perolatii TaxID=2023191 RepID=A0A2M9ZIS2_9LEPT|nr:transglycosylase SLT domain-containing protein [Leptospira perolatii]PJZ68620.1 transglycosylase [Leptospira perolatii]PJZ71967.1 transglycosylase [Leptospira perolatii]